MKNFLARIRSAIAPQLWIVTVGNDYGETFQQSIRASSYRAAMREASEMTDSDWYSVSVTPA